MVPQVLLNSGETEEILLPRQNLPSVAICEDAGLIRGRSSDNNGQEQASQGVAGSAVIVGVSGDCFKVTSVVTPATSGTIFEYIFMIFYQLQQFHNWPGLISMIVGQIGDN